jgi:hypothetical protein
VPRGSIRMDIDHAPVGGNVGCITTPHTRWVGWCINVPIASTTPPHSPPSTPCHDGKPWAYHRGCTAMPTVVPQGGRYG